MLAHSTAGTPVHSITRSTRRSSSSGVVPVLIVRVAPSSAATASRWSLTSVTIDLGGSRRAGDLRDEEPDRAGAGDEHAVAEPDLGALHGPDRDRERLDHRADDRVDGVGQRVGCAGRVRPGTRSWCRAWAASRGRSRSGRRCTHPGGRSRSGRSPSAGSTATLVPTATRAPGPAAIDHAGGLVAEHGRLPQHVLARCARRRSSACPSRRRRPRRPARARPSSPRAGTSSSVVRRSRAPYSIAARVRVGRHWSVGGRSAVR